MIVDIKPRVFRIIEVQPKSSLVETLKFDSDRMTMYVKYKSGKRKGSTREYNDITPEQFFGILGAESIGRAVLKVVQELKREYID